MISNKATLHDSLILMATLLVLMIEKWAKKHYYKAGP